MFLIVEERLFKRKETCIFWHKCINTSRETPLLDTKIHKNNPTKRIFDACTKCSIDEISIDIVPLAFRKILEEKDTMKIDNDAIEETVTESDTLLSEEPKKTKSKRFWETTLSLFPDI